MHDARARHGGPRRPPRAAVLDIERIEQAGRLIVELGVELDRQLDGETRSDQRLRMLRETTNRITRAANDAVHAYQRARRSLDAEQKRASSDTLGTQELRQRLLAARESVLVALRATEWRYPAASAREGQPPVTR